MAGYAELLYLKLGDEFLLFVLGSVLADSRNWHGYAGHITISFALF